MPADLNAVKDSPLSDADETQAMFNKQLSAYRRIVGENLMFHREVYGLLRDVLSEQMPKPFRFLDIACGDASASAAALRDTTIAHYYGIDLSARSLELASENLKVLPCAFKLRCGDFAEAMTDWSEPVDVAWIGMSLHHLQPQEKGELMKNVHKALTPGGLFLIWEPTLLEGETRAEWLDRFSELREEFVAVTDDEFHAMDSHIRLADFPESADAWIAMGYQAGFGNAEELFVMPNRMGRVFKYWN